MATRRAFYENTSPGHNKDYLIEWDQETHTVTSTYGPIGGHKTVRVNEHSSYSAAEATFMGKAERRARHGYSLCYEEVTHPRATAAATGYVAIPATISRTEFLDDVRMLQMVEKNL